MQSFRIPLTYTDAELETYERLIRYRYARRAGPGVTLGQVATGVVAALVAGLICVAAHAATPDGAGLVVVLVFAAFWAGCWTPTLLSRRRNRRAWRAYYTAQMARLDGAVAVATADLLVLRTRELRSIYQRSAFQRAAIEGPILLLSTGWDAALAIPLRLLTPEQRDWLLSFHAASATPAAG